MKGFIRAIILALVAFSPLAFSDDETRDFYAEPGMNPFRTAAGQDPTENIDPFSGNVQLSYVDLSIPGNGGLDLDISRYYNLPQSSPGYANPYGYGWTMHFGRITIGSGHARQLCANAAVPGGDTVDNPAIEMPSGGRELLVRSSVLDDGTYITKSNWRAKCIDDTDYTRGIVATAPDGTAYYMREYVFMQGEDGPNGEAAPTVETWLTNQVVDAYGNTLDVTYLEIASGMKLVSRIDASDGRQVLFEYLDTGDSLVSNSSVNARLSAIQANGQRWLYEYAPISGGEAGWGLIDHYELTAVVRPDGTRWLYEYGSDETAPEYRRLTMVTYPTGGKISYSYQLIRPYLPNPDFTVVAIDTKTQTNPGYPVGNWTYEFEPGSVDFADLGVQPLPENSGRLADLTKITTPAGVEHVYHVGYWALVGTHEILWEMGLKIRHEFFAVDPANGALDIVRRVSNSWASRTISDEVYRGGILSALWDSRTYAPALSRQTVVLDGHTYATDYSNYDAFGNPGTTRQYSIYPTENDTRVTTTTYLNETNGWFIGLPETATLHQDGVVVGTISRTYNTLGRLQSEDRFGVTTQYAYTDQGDVALVTDALGHSTSYSEYFRGVAQLHELPDGSERSSMIDPSGTIASKTSGRGHTTVFAYDGLNRLTGINYPVNASVSISYHAAGKVLTRGVYREAINWDGFGRQTSVIREDLVNGSRYTNTFVYDESGRKVFASDVNSAGGISWVYDNIGRTLRVTNQDGSYKSISYEGAHRELHQDENNNVVDYRFQVYGSPENRFLSWTLSPEGIATHIRRDGYGNVAWIFQGALDAENPNQYRGYIQSYGYNERLQLSSIDSPADIGLTTFGRDVVGNMTSKQVGASATTVYRYDAMGRIETVDYPEESLDIRNIYDADGQVISVTNGYAARHYAYDENGSLVNESVETGGALYQLDYLMDELDHLSVLTYPSGRVVHYSPDALGRASQAMPYLSNVSYYPDGSLEKMVYANGRIADFTRTITNRLDTIHIDGLIDLDYQYDPAGNVTAIQDLLSPSSTRAMSYDGLHRLKSVQAGWGGSVYDYDAYSNLIRKSDPARNNRSQYYRYLGLLLDRISFEGVAASRGFTYDDYGNINYSDDVIYDVLTGLPLEVRTTRQHLFDDAGNLVFSRRSSRDELDNVVALTSGSFSSEYDGKNNRIRKINHSNGNHITDYLHSNDGLLRGEYDDAGVVYGNEYFYLGKRPIATAKYNSPPVVSAGDDIQVYSGATVQLSASHADIDGEVVSSVWSQVSGPEVVLDNPAASDTFFIAPNLADTAFIVLQYAAVDDNGAQTTQLVRVSVAVNFPPVADAGLDQNVLAASAVELDGSASSDVEGPVSYNWSGSYLADEFKVNPTIQFPELGFNYSKTYTLTVTDAQGAIDTDTVEINVYTSTADADEDGLPDGWEVVHFGDTTSYGETDDPDGDGVLNAQEWVDSTSPVLADEPTAVSKIAIIAGDGENVVVWERTPAAAQFDVYWSEDASTPVATWQRASVTRRYFEHAALANSATYHYVVVAANALGVAEPSPVVHGTPGAHAWKPPQRQPDGLTSLAADATWVATNRFGDTVLLAQKYEESVHRLYLWQSSMFDDFGTVELVNEDSDPQGFAKVAIDQDGNVMVSWAGGPVGSRNLYAAYRPYGKPFRTRATVEHYSADAYVDGDVVDLSHLEFADNGAAFVCWRQNRLHIYNNLADTSGASALVKKFDPRVGWREEHNLEVLNNVGDTLNLRCDVSADGAVVAAWERYNTYDPQSFSLGGLEHDVWVATLHPAGNWTTSETVEFLKEGIREANGSGVQNHQPRVASNNHGTATVVWYNASAVNIESLQFDFQLAAWSSQETLESRGKQIPDTANHQVAANGDGDVIAGWGGKYRIRPYGTSGWARSKALPAPAVRLGIDELGQPYSVHISAADVIASRYIAGRWVSQRLNEAVDAEVKTLVGVSVGATDALQVQWLSGSVLQFSTEQPDPGTSAENTAPIASAGADQSVAGGALVRLDGSASRDPDGAVTAYFWEQTEGTSVSLLDPASQQSEFVAPLVAFSEDLLFRLTVTDDDGATDEAVVTITVMDDVPDTTAPETIFSTQVKKIKGAERYTIVLQPNESATTFFRFSGQGVITTGGDTILSWQLYTEPVVIQLQKNGSGSLEFYSEDSAGNVEATQLEVLQ